MQKFWPVFVVFTAIFLAGCQQKTEGPPLPTITQPSPTIEPTIVEPTKTIANIDYCRSCHTDKEQLISTAKPEEPTESESKGVG